MAKTKKVKFYDLLNDVIINAYADRAKSDTLLEKLEKDIKSGVINSQEHGFIGNVVAKYLDVRSRANEQLVKLVAVLQRHEATEDEGVAEKDIDETYEAIEKGN